VSETLEYGPLGRLALSRSTVDRATERRNDTAWVERAWADPDTRVLVIQDGRSLARDTGNGYELLLIPSVDAPEGTRFLLGVDDDGVAYFGVSGKLAENPAAAGEGSDPAVSAQGETGGRDGEGFEPVALRQVGALLSDRDAGLLTHAVALANWHDSHTHCPRCGTATVPAPAGHLATCPKDGTQHFPRLDPAVIMLVTDPEERCLLARNATWPERRMSVLAGFVEPGESIEHAVAREVAEETSIRVGQIEYLGSQPWPMPRSLMLGFKSVAPGGQEIRVDEDEIIEARWFTRAELRAAIDAGEVAIAPTSSIARRLIEYWYGGALTDASGAWTTPNR
jgi:NAD+ diphosphatase